jgi:hypothetical protein
MVRVDALCQVSAVMCRVHHIQLTSTLRYDPNKTVIYSCALTPRWLCSALLTLCCTSMLSKATYQCQSGQGRRADRPGAQPQGITHTTNPSTLGSHPNSSTYQSALPKQPPKTARAQTSLKFLENHHHHQITQSSLSTNRTTQIIIIIIMLPIKP